MFPSRLTEIHPNIQGPNMAGKYRIFSNLIRILFSFREQKNQMRIGIECGLDSQSRAGFWKNDRAGVRAVRTIQLFIILFIIL
jgi:hypothetical protein